MNISIIPEFLKTRCNIMNETDMLRQCISWLESRRYPLAGDDATLSKAGIIPLFQGECLLMKPVAKHKELSPPGWQIAKGTRMMQTADTRWVDMPPEAEVTYVLEPLVCTALREGIEEVGLQLENIKALADIGTFGFASARSGKAKWMRVFACEVASKQAFLPKEALAKTTEATGWFSLATLPEDMRQDNIEILESLMDFL